MPSKAATRTARSMSALGFIALLTALPVMDGNVASAAPGAPGEMAAPTVVLYEGFESPLPPTTSEFVQTIADYDSGGPASAPGYVGEGGQRYAADDAWNGRFCNGLIVTGEDPATLPTAQTAADCQQSGWNQSLSLASTLGLWAADPEYPYPLTPTGTPGQNHAVTAYTQGDVPPGVMASTVVPAITGNFYTATVDVAQANCWTTNPVSLSLQLSDGVSTPTAVFPGPISACALPVHQFNGNNVGTFIGVNPYRAESASVVLALVNELGGGGGDDNAFDNLAVLDITPQLDAVFMPAPSGSAYTSMESARLVFTITNTHLAGSPQIPSGAKPEWSFVLTLPDGLVVAGEPHVETTCAESSLSSSGSSITGAGSLGITDVSCTLSVDVTSAGGEYTLTPSMFTSSGLLAPAETSIAFTPRPAADPSGAPNGALAASGVDVRVWLTIGAVTTGAGLLVLAADTRARRRARMTSAGQR